MSSQTRRKHGLFLQITRSIPFIYRSGITFSDGTPVTAQTYIYTLTRALLPEVKSPIASFFEQAIVGSSDVSNGKTRVLSGVKALDDQTLQITLMQPTPYFLQVLTNAVYFPLNKRIIDQYGQADWVNHAAGNAIGTGPFMVKEWDHNVKMVLVPNPHYYGNQTKLAEVDMLFVNDLNLALQAYRAGLYTFRLEYHAGATGHRERSPGLYDEAVITNRPALL